MSAKQKAAELASQAVAAADKATSEIAKAAKATRQLLMGDPTAEFEEAFKEPEVEEPTEPPERVEARRRWRDYLRRKPKP
jgi:hypothetical protein